MRRRWGKGFDFTFLRNGSLPKLPLRKWGKSNVSFLSGSSLKPPPRKWGRSKWFPAPNSSGYSAVKKFSSPKPRRRMKRTHFWLLMILIFLFIFIQTTIFLDRELRGPLMFLAKIKINQMATEAINTAISDEIAQSTDSDNLIQWKTNADGKITGFLIDYKEQMGITARTILIFSLFLTPHTMLNELIIDTAYCESQGGMLDGERGGLTLDMLTIVTINDNLREVNVS